MRHRVLTAVVVFLVVFALCAGAGQILAKKPGKKECPTPFPYCMCPAYIDPVVCQRKDGWPECRYTNMCFARCAGFRDSQCTHNIGD